MANIGEDVYSLVSLRMDIGTSTIVGVTVFAGLNSVLVKYYTGGSLEIGGATLSWGNGYLFSGGEALSINARGTFYLCATGATASVMMIAGRSAGFE